MTKIKVENLTSSRSNRSVANQFKISIGDDLEIFQSYNRIICHKIGKTILLDERYWNYSKTTSKYLHQFLGINKATILQRIKDKTIELRNLN